MKMGTPTFHVSQFQGKPHWETLELLVASQQGRLLIGKLTIAGHAISSIAGVTGTGEGTKRISAVSVNMAIIGAIAAFINI